MKGPVDRANAPVSYDPSDEELVNHEPGKNGDAPIIAALPARGLDQFTVPPDDDPTVLLGNRYLCRGDGMVLVSSAGMGKSALNIQAAVTFALGRPFMGIQPNGPLRSLIIQSEDSDGDIGEVWASICHMMQLTDEEKKLVSERVKVVSDRVNRGLLFIAELKRQLALGTFDLVWINPLAAYATGDIGTQEAMGDFLRSGLNSLNPGLFAYIIIQHTTKPPTGRDRAERKWHEIMYDMAGSYDIIGWARAIMSLRPTETMGEFNLVLAKRGRRAGVTKKVPQGIGYRLENTIIIPIKHSTGKFTLPHIKRELDAIFWESREESTPSPSIAITPKGRPKAHGFHDFITIFPTDQSKALGVRALHRAAVNIKPIGINSFYVLLDEAVADYRLVRDHTDPKSPVYYLKPTPPVKPKGDEDPLF